MKKPAILIAFISLFALYSCGGGGGKKPEALKTDDFRTESALGLYQISVPDYMKTATDLNADASMQFQNIFKETYLAIIDEDKQDFVDAFEELGEYDSSLSTVGNYRDIQVKYFFESLDLIRKGEPQKITVNGLPAEQIEFVGRVAGVNFDIYYLMTFVEGQEDLYMIMSWTLGDSEEKYKETFAQMADSFKEI